MQAPELRFEWPLSDDEKPYVRGALDHEGRGVQERCVILGRPEICHRGDEQLVGCRPQCFACGGTVVARGLVRREVDAVQHHLEPTAQPLGK